MKVGDFVKVDYVGRLKDTGEIFDLTKEDLAKEEDVYNPKTRYGPVVLIVGAEFIIKGLDEVLREMNVNEKRHVEVPPKKAFGKRKPGMIKVIPLSKFKEQGLDPSPGEVVKIGKMRGRVLSIDGGRVKVDFNHPLAGKTLEYDIEIKDVIKDTKERVKSLVKYFTGIDEIEVEIEGEEVEVEIKKDVDVVRPLKKMISEKTLKWCDIEKVKFIESFEKESEEEETKESVPEK